MSASDVFKNRTTRGSPMGTPPRPDVFAMLSEIIINKREAGEPLPSAMPIEPNPAAHWFFNLMEPEQSDEKMFIKKDLNGVRIWHAPHHLRVRQLFLRFCNLDDVGQAIVIGASEEGIYWRGENMHDFYEKENSVYNEVIKMREEGQSYKDRAMQGIHGILGIKRP